jgi:hypothetical protein
VGALQCESLPAGGSKGRQKLEEGATIDYEAWLASDPLVPAISPVHFLLFVAEPEDA